MDDLGVSQSDLARSMDTAQSTVHRWLNGSMPRGKTLRELCETLRTHKEWLLEGTGPMEINFSHENTTKTNWSFRDGEKKYEALPKNDAVRKRNEDFLQAMPDDALLFIAETVLEQDDMPATPEQKNDFLKAILQELRSRKGTGNTT